MRRRDGPGAAGPPGLRPLGPAWLERPLGPGDPAPAALLAWARADPAVLDVVATDTVFALRLHPGVALGPGLSAWLDPGRGPDMPMPAARPAAPAPTGAPPTRHLLPVRYDGPDLDAVARALGWTAAEVVAAHAGGSYRVAFCGFVPGFAYLDGLDPRLALPRRPSPRPRVPPGAVGIAGLRCGVYPFATPGGWNLLGGVEGVALFDPTAGPRLAPGDEVRFEPSPGRPRGRGVEEGARREGAAAGREVEAAREGAAALGTPPPRDAAADPATLLLLAVQGPAWVMDLGAPGWAWAGLARGGAAAPEALRRANRALGNPEDAAGIEVYGPLVARLPPGRRAADGEGLLQAGGELHLAPAAGRRLAYLAVEGGIVTDPVLGSRSAWTALGLGGHEGRALRGGDTLPLGPAHRRPGRLRAGGADPADEAEQPLSLWRPAGVPDATWAALLRGPWRLAEPSSRVGLRLDGPPLPAPLADQPSRPMVVGAVELPPDGRPIVLGPEHPTVGGYPLVGVLGEEALAALYTRPTGAAVQFRPTS